MLKDLIISKVRVKILQEFFADVEQMIHVRDLMRRTGEEINAVRRELAHLESVGLLKKEPRGNRIYYWLRKDYPLFGEILAMVSKTIGLGGMLVKNRMRLGKIDYIMVSGKFLRKAKRKEDEVDLLVVGDVVLPELAKIVREEEVSRGEEINYTVMSEEELKFRKSRKDPFLQQILAQSRVMIFGDEQEMVEI